MDVIRTTNNELLKDNQTIKEELDQLKQQQLARLEKEKSSERHILIRDMFSIPLTRLSEELKSHNLSETQVGIFSRPTITTTKLESDYPLLYTILRKVSEEFEINSAAMLLYLKEKKMWKQYVSFERRYYEIYLRTSELRFEPILT